MTLPSRSRRDVNDRFLLRFSRPHLSKFETMGGDFLLHMILMTLSGWVCPRCTKINAPTHATCCCLPDEPIAWQRDFPSESPHHCFSPTFAKGIGSHQAERVVTLYKEWHQDIRAKLTITNKNAKKYILLIFFSYIYCCGNHNFLDNYSSQEMLLLIDSTDNRLFFFKVSHLLRPVLH